MHVKIQVRHAQGMHNLESEKSRDPLTSYEFSDAELSSLGWQQIVYYSRMTSIVSFNRFVTSGNKFVQVDSSRRLRTLQTAVGIFHGEDQPDRLDVTSFEDEKVKGDDETSTFNRPPIIAYELCRERMGKYECDRRGTISQYRSRFPEVDFSLIENEDDILWKADERETHEEVMARAMKFIKWLWERQEKEIAVVSHGVFLDQTMIELFKNNKCSPLNDYDPHSRFRNCEIRSVKVFNESVMGLGSDSFSNHCGRIRIPYGLEVVQIRDSTKDNVSVEELEVTN
ncbi:phosphoglycerate mutase-like protein isoform X3 [Durio zibethinus]|uniref:Phosphoglycerate mutase-like protein isoform X3 n=1 Tax=Durio zibethinus TaxID=66656 RepID=A0A6P6AUN2_DURZI|nr:phosphoglycerate mutase-like protein isoform X3 [Durio zibethinus]